MVDWLRRERSLWEGLLLIRDNKPSIRGYGAKGEVMRAIARVACPPGEPRLALYPSPQRQGRVGEVNRAELPRSAKGVKAPQGGARGWVEEEEGGGGELGGVAEDLPALGVKEARPPRGGRGGHFPIGDPHPHGP